MSILSELNSGISFAKGTAFPFLSHKERINRYKENMKMFKGEYKDIFDKYNFNPNSNLYVSLNLSGIICKKSADLLLGEAVQVSAGKDDHSDEQQALDKFTVNNYMNITNYESALNNSIKGDSFYKVRYGQEWAGELPQHVDPSKVLIENLQAEQVFPETFPHDKRKIRVFHVCVPVYDGNEGSWILKVESHFAGRILYHNHKMSVTESDQYGYATGWKIDGQLGEVYEEYTGINMPLVIHVPNIATDSWEGQDDLSEHKSLFDEINNRLSQIAAILDMHSNPAMAIPAGVMEVDDLGNPIFNVSKEKVFEIQGTNEILPQYITWNGQLQEAYSELDRLIDNLLMAAEIPPVAIGRKDSGTSGNTGLAIKTRMIPLLSKVNRKRQYYDKALKQVYMVAQQLDNVTGDGKYIPVVPILQFKDGLPVDDMAEANIAAIRTGSKPTMSQKTAIMQLNNMTEEQADAEIERITQETERDNPPQVTPNMFNEYPQFNSREETSDPVEPESPAGEGVF